MLTLTDLELLTKVASIYSQQTIADRINHPREVINRWLKKQTKQPDQEWLTHGERINLEGMLPSPRENRGSSIDLI